MMIKAQKKLQRRIHCEKHGISDNSLAQKNKTPSYEVRIFFGRVMLLQIIHCFPNQITKLKVRLIHLRQAHNKCLWCLLLKKKNRER